MEKTTCNAMDIAKCPCQNTTCERYGKCCACVAVHAGKGNLPACLRENAVPTK